MKKSNIKQEEHRGNVHELIEKYQEEMKMINDAPRYFYSLDGGVKKIDD